MAANKTVQVEDTTETYTINDTIHGVDVGKLNAAKADYQQAIVDRKTHKNTLQALYARCEELDGAIMDVEQMLSDKPAIALGIEEIKQFASDQAVYQSQFKSLVAVRTLVEKQIKEMDERHITIALQDAKESIWRAVYEGLLTAINKEPLEQLFVAGSILGKPERAIVADLALVDDTRRLQAMVEVFGLPMGG